jgi:hypothetical protein
VDETAAGSANFFGPVSLGSILVHIHPPSFDPGVIALLWALGLGIFIYFGLIAIGTSGAFAIVVSMASFAGIWLFVRARGSDA